MQETLTAPHSKARAGRDIKNIAIVGNPNTGKTSVFNALTGLHQKVANYAGVTVEKKTGMIQNPQGAPVQAYDLPGLYSLIPKSLDDKIAYDILSGIHDDPITLSAVLVVVDAANLSRNLYLLTQILDLGVPVLLVLNMLDAAEKKGIEIDVAALEEHFNIPVVPVIAARGQGIAELRGAIFQTIEKKEKSVARTVPVPPDVLSATQPVMEWMRSNTRMHPSMCSAEALRVVSSEIAFRSWLNAEHKDRDIKTLENAVQQAREKLSQGTYSWHMLETKLRYAWVDDVFQKAVRQQNEASVSITDKLDKILTHRFAGPLIFLAIFAFIFQAIFSWAELPMTLIEEGTNSAGQWIGTQMPDGVLKDLIVDGAVAGVGAVLVFLPQILFLFFFLGLLEDTGYMSRAAFIMDRLMKGVGLSGRSVIPLLSSFACAIPGIMATRTIHNWRDRLVTIMIAPFMSCSARLPVYILLIGAFVPDDKLFGVFGYQGLTLLSMYLLGILAAMLVAVIFKKFVVKEMASSTFVMELPPYRRPSLKWTALQMLERGKIFINDAGKIILAISIVLWFLAYYPRPEQPVQNGGQVTSQIKESYAGQLGKLIEPAIEPLGFDWKIGIGLVTSFAAREVMVSTLATIYNVEGDDETSVNLRTALQNDRNPQTGEPTYSLLTAISLMVFFVLACQCMATVAIVKRETNSWRWPLIMVGYMTAMAYLASLIVYQAGQYFGIGI